MTDLMPYDRANTLRLIDETDRATGHGIATHAELERRNQLQRADDEVTRLTRLIGRLRPYVPTHGTHAEDLINEVEAVLDRA